jgi:hypothetical protein
MRLMKQPPLWTLYFVSIFGTLDPANSNVHGTYLGWAGVIICSYSPHVIFREKHMHVIQTYHIWKEGGGGGPKTSEIKIPT